MNRIAVLTSGGDAPGMNANVRTIVRTACARNIEVIGIRNGYAGLLAEDMGVMTSKSVGGIVNRGGTILGTARCDEFIHPDGRAKAAEILCRNRIEGLIVCGGDGSFHGAHYLWTEHHIPVVGTPGTIDNDLAGTDFTIGFDTAVNTALEAIDRIRDTAESHRRIFIVEVMGRHAGFIALSAGVGGGADVVLVPEVEPDIPGTIAILNERLRMGKRFSLAVVAEGVNIEGYQGGGSLMFILKREGLDARLTVLGHQQRGGAPTALDREIASILGAAAVEELLRGGTDVMAGYVSGKVAFCPLENTWKYKKPLDMAMLNLVHEMAI